MKYPTPDALTLKKWVIFSTLGWVLGVIMISLMALFLEVLNLGFSSQAVVGLGMGLGVGLMQWLILKKFSKIDTTWLIASMGGLGFSYILADVFIYFYEVKPEILSAHATGLGAIISAWFQERLVLNKMAKQPSLWVPYSFTAWIIAHSVTMGLFYMSGKINSEFPSYISIMLALLFLVIGGPILGYITSMGILPVVNHTLDEDETDKV